MAFTGKTIIVTGATSGIGRAAAEAFGRDGASTVLVGRHQAELEEASAAVRAGGAPVACCQADVTTADAPQRIVDVAIQAFGQIDVLVNAAGVIASGTLEQTTDEIWDTMMAV